MIKDNKKFYYEGRKTWLSNGIDKGTYRASSSTPIRLWLWRLSFKAAESRTYAKAA
jgi:hypothetical protein